MADKTNIAWTQHTFNIAWGCTKVSPGCKNCYADALATRYGKSVWGPTNPRRTFGDNHWREPLKWDKEARANKEIHRVFCSSMCDNFEDHPTIIKQLPRLWNLIRITPHLHWQLLTKRADRILQSLPEDWNEYQNGYPNVWLGVSIESMEYAWRADCLREIPATVHFISYEPALGPLHTLNLTGIDWVIFGGESGSNYREAKWEWSRQMKEHCQSQGVSYFHKQFSGFLPERGTLLDGKEVREYPTPRRSPVIQLPLIQ